MNLLESVRAGAAFVDRSASIILPMHRHAAELRPPAMPLRLVYTADTKIPVEVEGLTPDFIVGKSLADVERFEVFHGNEKRPLPDFFNVSGQTDDGCIDFEGNLAGVHWIGAHMTQGTIHVEGNAGRHVGSEMTGGEIHVRGDAGDWVGGEMHGGLVHVRGRAGHLIGAAYRGSRRGMTGGTILIDGPVGNEIGHTMRRGLLAVGGCGDFAGISMIAGSILVFGECGIRPGAGMRRGTIGLFGPKPPKLLPTFRTGGREKLLILTLLFRHLAKLDYPFEESLAAAEYQMFHGDTIALGRGEILVPERAG
jgi:formylmethanofuran dehydrogenase subunit C